MYTAVLNLVATTAVVRSPAAATAAAPPDATVTIPLVLYLEVGWKLGIY